MRAFLSSTYSDLIEHRRMAAEALRQLGYEVAQMELFGARPQVPTEACIDEINGAEIFVGVYAHRYGYVPEGQSASITETEFWHAHKTAKPIFCFVVEDDHPWLLSMVEGEPGKSRLLALKSQINNAVVRATFRSPEDLALKIATAVGQHTLKLTRSAGRDLAQPSASPFALSSVAGAAVAQTLAMLFVDLMRLLYVASSETVRKANEQHYGGFVVLAERHLTDLRAALSQFATALDVKSHERSVPLQRRLSYVFDELKKGPTMQEDSGQYWSVMREIADGVDEFCSGVAAEQYLREVERAQRHINSLLNDQDVASRSMSLEDTLHIRLAIQSRLLEESRNLGETTLFSIANDMDQRFGIPYFVIDHRLLRCVRN